MDILMHVKQCGTSDDVKQNLRVLMITVRADYGGGPEHVYRLIEALSDKIQPFIACPQDIPYWGRFLQQVGKQHMLEIPHRQFSILRLIAMYQFIKRYDIQMIHSHGKGAGIYGRILALITNKPCIHSFHGVHVDKYSKWKKELYLLLERFFSLLSTRLIAVSPGEAEKIRSLRLCSNEKLVVVNNGVVMPNDIATVNCTDNNRLGILSMTRFDYAKNSELVVPIAKHLNSLGQSSKYEVVFLGAGEAEPALKREVEKAGMKKNILFKGAVQNPGDYLQQAFCYLSTSRWEGMPLGVLEAMAQGIPVIATDVVGNRDVIEHGITGFLYPVDKPEKAAEFFCQLANDKNLWKQISGLAREKAVKEYSVERMAQETLKVYRDVLKSLKTFQNKGVS